MKEKQLYFFRMYLTTLKSKSCAAHNSHTVYNNLIIFGRDIYQVKKECHMQEGQLLFFSSYLP